MSSLDLARDSRDHQHGNNHRHHGRRQHRCHKSAKSEPSFRDPFVKTVIPAPQRPRACLPRASQPRNSQDLSAATSRHDSMSPSSYQASFASTGSSSLLTSITPLSSVDLEKAVLADEVRVVRKARVADPEKAIMDDTRPSPRQSRSHHPTPHPASPAGSIVISMTYSDHDQEQEMDDGRRIQESHALRILLFLSGPVVFLSFLNTAWALISIIITVLTQPVRICAKRPSFGLQLSGLLGPALNLQLRSIETPLSPHANEDGVFHAGWLFLVHLLAPFVSFCTMFMAWVVAVYWFSSALVGDPAGLDKRDDGRETVLGLRKWWESFLLKAVQADTYPAL